MYSVHYSYAYVKDYTRLKKQRHESLWPKISKLDFTIQLFEPLSHHQLSDSNIGISAIVCH